MTIAGSLKGSTDQTEQELPSVGRNITSKASVLNYQEWRQPPHTGQRSDLRTPFHCISWIIPRNYIISLFLLSNNGKTHDR